MNEKFSIRVGFGESAPSLSSHDSEIMRKCRQTKTTNWTSNWRGLSRTSSSHHEPDSARRSMNQLVRHSMHTVDFESLFFTTPRELFELLHEKHFSLLCWKTHCSDNFPFEGIERSEIISSCHGWDFSERQQISLSTRVKAFHHRFPRHSPPQTRCSFVLCWAKTVNYRCFLHSSRLLYPLSAWKALGNPSLVIDKWKRRKRRKKGSENMSAAKEKWKIESRTKSNRMLIFTPALARHFTLLTYPLVVVVAPPFSLPLFDVE